jgi:Ankyrin repeats (3 copies)
MFMLCGKGKRQQELSMASIRSDFYRVAAYVGAIDLDDDLRLAVQNGDTEKVNDLIAGGAHTGVLDDALGRAAKNGDTEKVNNLITVGADIHAGDDRALIEAAANGHADTVRALIKAGARVHGRDDEALLLATKAGHTDCVKELIAVPYSAKSLYAVTPEASKDVPEFYAHLAEENGHPDTAALLRTWQPRANPPAQQAPVPQPKPAGPRPM